MFDTLHINVIYKQKNYGEYIGAGKESDVFIENVKADKTDFVDFCVENPALSSEHDTNVSFGTTDIVAINQITIMRY